MRYHDIEKTSMVNGEGLRCVLWVSGCNHFCKGCQNPVTWNPNDGLLFDADAMQEIFEYCDKMWRGGWCEEHCKNNKLQEPDAECWLKYAEVMANDQ